jgi:hypothetical protein
MDERRPWTPEDILKLRSVAQKYPTTQAELKRGHSASVMKAHLLRISLRLKPKRGGRPADVSLNTGPAGTDLPTWNLDQGALDDTS